MTGLVPDEFHRLRLAFLRLRAALRDPNTGLFSYPYHFDAIRMLLADRPRIGVLWVGLGDRQLVETVYGWETYDRLLAAAADALQDAAGSVLDERSVVTMARVHADAFAVFTPGAPGATSIDAPALDLLAARIESVLLDAIGDLMPHGGMSRRETAVGAALLSDHPFHRFERRVHQAVDRARAIAERPHDAERLAWLGELQRLLRDRDVRCLFQTIVDLETGSPMALEAYARGPERSVFQLPRVMFSVSQEAGLAGDLDRVCRHKALATLAGAEPPRLLFLNTLAEGISDPDWLAPQMRVQLGDAGLEPSRVVLEVAESQLTLEPESYRERVALLRDAGYRISLDDAGSGPRTNALVEALRPDFLKFDMTVVRGLERDRLRREIVRSLADLAGRAGARLVAERIETAEERSALLECGAHWGQGYLFSSEMPLADRTDVAAKNDWGAP